MEVTPPIAAYGISTESSHLESHVASLDFQSPQPVIEESSSFSEIVPMLTLDITQDQPVSSTSVHVGTHIGADVAGSVLRVVVEDFVPIDPQTGSPIVLNVR